MHYTMNYAYDFQAAQLVHRPAKKTIDLKPPKPKTASRRRGLDPDDLTRRLQFVIAERNAHDEKKRKTKAAAAASKSLHTAQSGDERNQHHKASAADVSKDKRKQKGDSSIPRLRRRASKPNLDEHSLIGQAITDGHYVPQVAAAQFTLTTLGESPPDKSNIHKLSRAALKYHMEGVNANPRVASTAGPKAAPIEQANALRRAQTLREKNYDRNQFHGPSVPENDDPAILSPLVKRRSLYGGQTLEERKLRASRRKSTGSFLSDDPTARHMVFSPPLKITDLAAVAEAHRVDWTQSDELASRPPTPGRPKSASPSQTSKVESKWKFRGRLNSSSKPADEKSPSQAADHEEMPKSPIAAIFARFKR